jgi:hypothetical protein
MNDADRSDRMFDHCPSARLMKFAYTKFLPVTFMHMNCKLLLSHRVRVGPAMDFIALGRPTAGECHDSA